jgi:hypothetical protein
MKGLWGFLTLVVLPLLLSEFTDSCPSLARKLIAFAVRRLPEETRDRWREEWLGELASLDGRRLMSLAMALWILLRAGSMARILQGMPSLLQVVAGWLRALLASSRTLLLDASFAQASQVGEAYLRWRRARWARQVMRQERRVESIHSVAVERHPQWRRSGG